MSAVWWSLGGLALGLLLAWAALVVVVWRTGVGQPRLGDLLRLLPDVVRLVRRLAGDPELPTAMRWRLGLLLAYLALPIDLVPDVIPVVGLADDAALVVWTLRAVVRAAGPELVEHHWPGSPDGLVAVLRLVGQPAR